MLSGQCGPVINIRLTRFGVNKLLFWTSDCCSWWWWWWQNNLHSARVGAQARLKWWVSIWLSSQAWVKSPAKRVKIHTERMATNTGKIQKQCSNLSFFSGGGRTVAYIYQVSREGERVQRKGHRKSNGKSQAGPNDRSRQTERGERNGHLESCGI